MDKFVISEPTGDQCSARERLGEDDYHAYYALWYPQMGGYVGKAVAAISKSESCVDIVVWHDGKFPFSEDPQPHKSPAIIHHCDIDQFRRLADDIESFEEKECND